MDIEKLIEKFKNAAGVPDGITLFQHAATAIGILLAENSTLRKMQPVELSGESARSFELALEVSRLRTENAEMEKQLNEFSEFLCCMTGNLLSKTNYTARAMIEAAEDYQQRVCDDCDRVKVVGNDELIDELQSVQADLDRVTAERDAAVKDMEALMWFSGEGCHICAHEIIIHREPYVRSECALGNAAVCCPTWRGPQKED